MINKKSLWFLTLFSLILVLSVYYITMPSELLMEANLKDSKEEKTEVVTNTKEESAELVALKVEEEEKMLDKISELKKTLNDTNASSEEKNKAFEELQKISKNRSLEEDIESKLQKELNLSTFVSITDTDVVVVAQTSKHDSSLANKVMRSVQEKFEKKMNISVKFQK